MRTHRFYCKLYPNENKSFPNVYGWYELLYRKDICILCKTNNLKTAWTSLPSSVVCLEHLSRTRITQHSMKTGHQCRAKFSTAVVDDRPHGGSPNGIKVGASKLVLVHTTRQTNPICQHSDCYASSDLTLQSFAMLWLWQLGALPPSVNIHWLYTIRKLRILKSILERYLQNKRRGRGR